MGNMIRIDESIIRISNEVLAPVNTDPIHVWARKNIVLTKAYAEPGPFRVESSRYLIEPLNAIKDLKTRMVVVAAAVQTGKTLLADISIPWFVCNRPGPIQFSQATDPMIADHVKNRLYPLLANCKPLKNVLPPSEKDFTNTGIRFPHCTLYCNGEKETAFQAKSVQFAICDEVWLWDRGRLPEAVARVSAFDKKGTSKVLIVSQPGELEDDFDKVYKIGTCEEWSVPCLGCGEYFFPIWRAQHTDTGHYYGMIWDSNDITKPSGSYNMPELVKTIRYECKKCGFKHFDGDDVKKEWNKRGKYIATNPSATNSVRSFRWNAIVSRRWDLLVEEFLQAKELSDKGIHTNLVSFFQKRITQPHDPNYYQFVGNIKTDSYDVKLDWTEEVARFMTVDVQKYGFWVVIRAWSAIGTSKQLFFGKIETEEDVKKLQLEFHINNNSVFVDIGNTEKVEDTGKHMVYEFVDRNQWTGLRGDHWHDSGFDWNIRGQKVTLFYSPAQWIPNSLNKRHYYHFSPNVCRDILKELRDGKSHEFKCLDNSEYKRQMFAEKRVPVKDKYGQVTWRWKNMNNLPNHAWDAEVMQVVCALIHPAVHVIPKVKM